MVAPGPNLIGDISITKTVSVGSMMPLMELPPLVGIIAPR
jgi:hypothetical protein